MQDIIPFDFDGHDIRTITKDGDHWFVAADVAKVLEYSRERDMYRILADDENTAHNLRGIHKGPGNPNVVLVNEPGLYRAIFSSRSKKAEPFRRWVFHDVLPALRHTGQYIHEGSGIDRNLQACTVRYGDLMTAYGKHKKKRFTAQEEKVAGAFSRSMRRAGLPSQFTYKDEELYVTPGLAEVMVNYLNTYTFGQKDRALRHIKEHTHD